MKHVSILSKLWYKISCNTDTGIQKKTFKRKFKKKQHVNKQTT
jgi:hypothetical protein